MKKAALLFLLLYLCTAINSQNTLGNDTNIIKRTFVYKTIGKTRIHADLYQTNEPGELKPAIIWIHGGALMFGSRADIPGEQLKLYVKAGYNLISIDYRLAPETKLPQIISDVTDAIEWARIKGRDSLRIDTSKIFVVGQSGGAYLALLSGYFMKNPPQAIVSFYGYGNIRGSWYNKPDSVALTRTIISEERATRLIVDSIITTAPVRDRIDLYTYSRQKGIWPKLVTGHNPKKETKWFDKYSPVKNIHSNYPPVILIHGDKDLDVPFEESVLLDKKLTKEKVKHQFLRMKNYGHLFDIFEGGLSNPDVHKTFTEVINFLNNYIATSLCNCSSKQDTTKTITDLITRLEMNLSASGVEADDFPSIDVHIDFQNDSSRCEKTYYNPAFKSSRYRLSSTEIKKVLELLRETDINKLKAEYSVSRTDQPTSITTIYFGQRTFVIKDYGLEGAYPLQELYKIVYKY